MLHWTEFEDYVRDAGLLVKLRPAPPTLVKLILRIARAWEPGEESRAHTRQESKGHSPRKCQILESFHILSNRCLTQNTRQSREHLDFLWCSQEIIYCHNQISRYINSCPNLRRWQSAPRYATRGCPARSAARSAHKSVTTELCGTKSSVYALHFSTVCFQPFRTGPSASKLNKAFQIFNLTNSLCA